MWIDNHCHLPTDSDAAQECVDEAAAAGIGALINVGCDLAGSLAAVESAARFSNVWATVGVHPHDAKHGVEGLAELATRPKVVAIGECGLDYHYMHSTKEEQRVAFIAQIGLAQSTGLPLVIHTREAWDDTFEILNSTGVPDRTVFHCFTGGPQEAERCLALGAVLSFSGIVTFPGAPEVREAAQHCPSDRYMVETDAPYLAPVPHRGRKNRPALVVDVAAGVAAARGVPLDVVESESSSTAQQFYALSGGSLS